MAFIPLPLGVRVAMEFTKDGSAVVNVFHVTSTVPLLTANLTAIANVFGSWWIGNYAAESTNHLVLNQVVATDVSIVGGQQGIGVTGLPQAGLRATAAVPNNVAIVTSYRTPRVGRSFRGRSYWALLASTDVVDDVITLPQTATINADLLILAAALAAFPATLVVASYQIDGAPRVTAEATPVTTIITDQRVDTQRRRLLNVGI